VVLLRRIDDNKHWEDPRVSHLTDPSLHNLCALLVDLVVVVAVVSVGRCGGDACECGETQVVTRGENGGKPNSHFHNFCLRLLGVEVAVAVPVVSVALVATAGERQQL
jgi:hypothetical protein